MADDSEQPVPDLRARGSRAVVWLLRGVGALVAVAVAVGGLAALAHHRVRVATKEHADCLNAIYEHGTGDPYACAPALWLAKLWPWTYHRARQLESNFERRDARDAVELATLRDLDRAARDRAVARLLAADHATPPPNDVFFNTGGILKNAGARRALIARAGELSTNGLSMALDAAILLGRAGDVRRIAALAAPAGDKNFEWDEARGKALCLLGQRKQGLAALDSSLAEWKRSEPTSRDNNALLAKAACGGGRVTVEDVYRNRLGFIRLVDGAAPETLHRRRSYDAAGRLRNLVLLHRRASSDADAYLVEIDPSFGGLLRPPDRGKLSRWSILAARDEWPHAPAQMDETARALETMADRAKKRTFKPGEPLPTIEIARGALADPAPRLRWGAFELELEATVGWSARGRMKEARASAAEALRLARRDDVDALMPLAARAQIIPFLDLAGDRADALAMNRVVEAAPAARDPRVRATLDLQRAILLVEGGDLAAAYRLVKAPGPRVADTAEATAWLRAALALRLGKRDPPATAAPRTLGPDSHWDQVLAYWWRAATADAATQRRARWASHGESWALSIGANAVLPAVYYVLGRAAGHGDVELWLDAITPDTAPAAPALLAARAEAARWRGDASSAALWNKRLRAYDALATDDRAAYLLATISDL